MSRMLRSHWAFGVAVAGSIAAGAGVLTRLPGADAEHTHGVSVPATHSVMVDVGVPMSADIPFTPTLSLSLSSVNPDLEQLRGDCLTLPAGPGLIQCDDFLYRYSLLPVAR